MIPRLTITSIFVFCYLILPAQQDNCKVLFSGIAEKYEGECKKGLAHGKGLAEGIDKYEGDFKAGLPHGQGKYTWKNGEYYEGQWKKGLRHGLGIFYISTGVKETAMEGKWEHDKFVRKASAVKPYKITYKNNIGRIHFTRMGDGNIVRIKLSRNGRFSMPSNTTLYGNSGTEMTTRSFKYYKNVEFPFEGSIKFSAPNDFNAAIISSELRYEINQSGSWEIVISY